jgi:hypothetical protein
MPMQPMGGKQSGGGEFTPPAPRLAQLLGGKIYG